MYDETQIRSFASPLSGFLKSLGYSEKPVSRTTELNYYEIEYANDAISRTITFLLDDKHKSVLVFSSEATRQTSRFRISVNKET